MKRKLFIINLGTNQTIQYCKIFEMFRPLFYIIIFLLLFRLCISIRFVRKFRKYRKANPLNYLENFGYMRKLKAGLLGNRPPRSAITSFQTFMHIPRTGRLDAMTLRTMNQKRCGVPDKTIPAYEERRIFVRSLPDEKPWSNGKKDFTWYLKDPSRQFDLYFQKEIISRAMNYWSEVALLTFSETTSESTANIVIRFAFAEHGDMVPFDGPGGVLAHAFFPDSGMLHMDEEESWRDVEKPIGTIMTLVHELGHALGLKHSTYREAIMFPSRLTPPEDYVLKLHEDDINRMGALYGRRESRPIDKITVSPNPITQYPPQPTVMPTPPPNEIDSSVCDKMSRFDAIVQIPVFGENYEDIYVFTKDTFWKLDSVDGALHNRLSIETMFPNLPENKVSSAVYDRDENILYFFIWRLVYKYDLASKRIVKFVDLRFTAEAALMDPTTRNTALLFKQRGNDVIYFEFNTKDMRIVGGRNLARYRFPYLQTSPEAALYSVDYPEYMFFFYNKVYMAVNIQRNQFDGVWRNSSKGWLRCDENSINKV